MTDDLIRGVYTQFSKKELLVVAEELGVKTESSLNTRSLSKLILKDLQENGIPEDLSTVSDTLYSLLLVAEYIDENGNVLESSTAEVVAEETAEEDVLEIPDWICFSYADPRDPACNKCKLYDPCWNKRLQLRPQCFGKHKDHDPECAVCIEAPYCKKEITQNG